MLDPVDVATDLRIPLTAIPSRTASCPELVVRHTGLLHEVEDPSVPQGAGTAGSKGWWGYGGGATKPAPYQIQRCYDSYLEKGRAIPTYRERPKANLDF